MDLLEFYQVYVNDFIVMLLFDCKYLCDVDSQCKVIGYMDDISGVLCGLLELDYVIVIVCLFCYVFIKNCFVGN